MKTIFEAIQTQDIQALQTYIASGQTLACKDAWGKSPLQVAIAIGTPEIIQILIEQKANFCAVDVTK